MRTTMMTAIAVAGASMACSSAMSGVVYDDLNDFLDNTQSGYYHEDFSDVGGGGQGPSMDFGPVNGFSYTISAQGDGTEELFTDPGLMSTNSAGDQLVVEFTGDPVTAVGGNFFGSDIAFSPIASNMTVELNDGTVAEYESNSADAFAGFTTSAPIDSITIDAEAIDAANAWPTISNLYVGQQIPAPGAVALLGLAGLVGGRRRR